MKLRAAMLTDVGVVRDHNEDAAHIDPKHQFFIVADGMGGHAAGEVASDMAVQTVRTTLEGARKEIAEFAESPDEAARKALIELLETSVRAAHRSVYERGSRESDKHGMGTTLEVVLMAGSEAFIAHVGDSRTYLVRENSAVQITTDHTVAEVLVIEGKLSAEEAQMSPLRTILVNAIGVAAEVGIEMVHVQLRDRDQLLLCSDGLHDYFPSEQELAERISSNQPTQALAELVELAKERGGHDNITGIIVDVDASHGNHQAEHSASTSAMDDIDGVTQDDDVTVNDHFAVADTMPVEANLSIPGLRFSSVNEGDEDEDDEDDDDLDHRTTQPIEVVSAEDAALLSGANPDGDNHADAATGAAAEVGKRGDAKGKDPGIGPGRSSDGSDGDSADAAETANASASDSDAKAESGKKGNGRDRQSSGGGKRGGKRKPSS